MKDILVLVDFTETAMIAVQQAVAIAERKNASISMCYVSKENSSDTKEGLIEELEPYADVVRAKGIALDMCIEEGDLFVEVSALVRRKQPALVVIGTHGKEGIRKMLFGSAIHKLVREIPAPSLVVNDELEEIKSGFDKVMLAVAPHKNFVLKVEQASDLLSDNGKVMIFSIMKPGVGLDAGVQENIRKAQELLDSKGKKWEYLEVEADRFSVGFAKQTLDVVSSEGMDLISIMAQVSNQNQHFGKIDKENVLLNELGVPVLCSNE